MNSLDNSSPRGPKRLAGIGAAVVATVFWASAAVLGKSIQADPLVMLTWREMLVVSVLFIFARIRNHHFHPRDLRASTFAPVLFAVHVIVFFVSIQITSIAIVVLIYALAPMLIMPLAAWQFGERPSPVVWALALVSVGGIALVVGGSHNSGSHPTLGVVISVANVCAWVAFTFASKQARSRGVPTLTWLTAANIGALIFSFAGVLVTGESMSAVASTDWWRIAALALIPGLAGHALMVWSYRSIDVSLASVIAVGEPVLGTAGAAVFLGESLSAWQVIGIAIVCGAVALVVWSGSRSSPITQDAVQHAQ